MANSLSISVKTYDGDALKWDEFVAGHPEGTFFHQYDWLQVIQEVYGGRPFYLAAYEDKRLVGVLPLMLRRLIGAGRVLVSVPFADEGGLLASSPAAEQALLEAAQTLGQQEKVAYVELRQMRLLRYQSLLQDISRVTIIQRLTSLDTLWSTLNAKVRNQIRKAQKSGLTTWEGSHELLWNFYSVYATNMRDLGSPMHTQKFFEAIFKYFSNSLVTVLVQLEKQTIGAALLVFHKNTAYVPWASSLRKYFSLCPNNLLYWRCMELALQNSCNTFDFGRSAPNSGTYHFKLQWGGTVQQLFWSYFPIKTQPTLQERRESLAYKLFSRVWRHVPVPLATTIGPHIFSRIPV